MKRPYLTPANLINNYTKNDRLHYIDFPLFLLTSKFVQYLTSVQNYIVSV